jgi:hypothetical protein
MGESGLAVLGTVDVWDVGLRPRRGCGDCVQSRHQDHIDGEGEQGKDIEDQKPYYGVAKL